MSDRAWPYEPREPAESARAAPVCSLPAEQLRERVEELRRDFFPQVLAAEDIPDGLVLWFERTEERFRQVADYALYESECCAFLDFGIGLAGSGTRIALRISAPDDSIDAVRRVVREKLAQTTASA